MTIDEPVENQRLDWLLAERVAGERAADAAEQVLRRFRAGEGADLAAGLEAAPRRRARSTFALAAALFGVAVVLLVAWSVRSSEETPAQSPEKPAMVASADDIDALPANTVAVEAFALDDAAVARLARLTDLRDLSIHYSWNAVAGLGLKTRAPQPPPSITPAAFPVLGSLSKLRRLRIEGAHRAFAAETTSPDPIAELERLPLLGELTLAFLDSEDGQLAALPRLRSLRSLDLSWNHGFGARGIDAILRCEGLERLRLDGCQQLHGVELGRLAALPRLRELGLSLIDGFNWRAGMGEDERCRELRATAERLRAAAPCGPTDQALAQLAGSTSLRVLHIGGGAWTDGGLAPLAGLSLVELDLSSGRARPGDRWVQELPGSLRVLVAPPDCTDTACEGLLAAVPELESLDICASYQITDAGIAAVCRLPRLRSLWIRQMRGLTAAVIDVLCRSATIEELDLRHCDFVTAEHELRLRREMQRLRVLQTSVGAPR
ncbi:MAG: hypothetical protein IPK26_23915 [Planctomycetes bacterium]|nr:hypothetical protein [Planctomycetota bacterium]